MLPSLSKVIKIHPSICLNISSVALIICLGLFLIVNFLSVSRDKILEHLPLFCLFKTITGIGCPGCGMTRAFLELAEGNFIAAFHLNPFSVPFFLAIVFSAFKISFPVSPKVKSYLFAVTLFLILAWWFWMRLMSSIN